MVLCVEVPAGDLVEAYTVQELSAAGFTVTIWWMYAKTVSSPAVVPEAVKPLAPQSFSRFASRFGALPSSPQYSSYPS